MEQIAGNQNPQTDNSSDSFSYSPKKGNLLMKILIAVFVLLVVAGGTLYYFVYFKQGKTPLDSSLPGISITSQDPNLKVGIKDRSVFTKYFKIWNLDDPSGVYLKLSDKDLNKDIKVKVGDIKVEIVSFPQPNGKIYDKDGEQLIEVGSYSATENSGDLIVQTYFNKSFYINKSSEDKYFAFSNVVFETLYEVLRQNNISNPGVTRQEINEMLNDLKATIPLEYK